MRAITITTQNYALNAVRLVRSLKRVHPECTITVYTESSAMREVFASLGASIHVLKEIRELGVKRAKFTAYAHAAQGGGFAYFDADIVVLQPLDQLFEGDRFTACRDDLSECPFITDSSRPWDNAQELDGSAYFNSGVFSCQEGYADFFLKIAEESLVEGEWQKFIVPGRLYDNHFLCAKTAQYRLDINFLPEHEYNWQGFRRFNQLNCYVDECCQLRNTQTHALLRLAHFAGVPNIDAYLASLPGDVSAILARAVDNGEPVGYLEALRAAMVVGNHRGGRISSQVMTSIGLPSLVDVYKPGAEQPLLGNSRAMASLALSTAPDDFLWNGLKCGASYLSAQEYKKLRDFISHHEIQSVLEFGAGYTTKLFRESAKRQVALEGWRGPWFDFAVANGCDARIVPFSDGEGFDLAGLCQAVSDVLIDCQPSMVFLDSPQGTANRSVVIDQLLAHASNADFYVVHDSVRDSANVYRLARLLNLQVVEHLASWRGLTFLARRQVAGAFGVDQGSLALAQRVGKVRFAATGREVVYSTDEGARLQVEIHNVGDVDIPCGGNEGLRFSLHLLNEAGDVVVWDTARYELPVDLSPRDRISFCVVLPSSYANVASVECDFVKEGEFWWSHCAGMPCPKIEF